MMLLKHIHMTHSDHVSFSNLQGCKRTLRILSTYLGHVHSHLDCGILDTSEPDHVPCSSGQCNDTFDGSDSAEGDSTIADNTIGGESIDTSD